MYHAPRKPIIVEQHDKTVKFADLSTNLPTSFFTAASRGYTSDKNLVTFRVVSSSSEAKMS